MMIYYCVVNIVGFLAMGIDKYKAIHNRYRISEKQLWLMALCFGALGSTLGMYCFSHKTRKWYFKYGFPLLTMIQIIILIK